MKNKIKILESAILTLILLSSIVTLTTGTNIIKTTINNSPYNGRLLVYVVEPTSRWNNNAGEPYHYGFLDFAIDETLSINYQDTYEKEVTWYSSYINIQENNIMIIATVFNPESHQKYAYPPTGNPFNAYYVDASAGAKPGETGTNIVNEEFTHTVFIEEATSTWCPHCPAMANALNNIYKSGEYPFYFVAMIADKVDDAKNRLVEDYNLYGYPSAFIDGGYKVMVGGSSNENQYISRIMSSGSRDVHEMDLTLSVGWIGNGDIDISITILNKEEMGNLPPSPPQITGPASGKTGTSYDYTFVSTDPNGDNVFYCIDWGDDTEEVCAGPFPSGVSQTMSHTWNVEGTYSIKAKAIDIFDAESTWGTLEVAMPKNINPDDNQILIKILQILINTFPSLETILGPILDNLIE